MKTGYVKKMLTYLLSIVICFVSCLLALKKGGYYPFGTKTILFWDGYQQTGPFCYYVWDVVHGKSSLFLNWKIAAGANMLCIYDMFSPINILYLFIERSMVPYVQDYFFVIRVILMAIAFQFFIHTIIKKDVSIFTHVFCSCAYAMSIWTFKFANIPYFLDAAFYVPLLCAFLVKIFDERKCKKRYAFILALAMLSGAQPAYVVILFVFLFAGMYLWANYDFSKWGHKIFTLGIYTLLGIGVSAVFFMPIAVGALASGRLSEGSFIQDFLNMLVADDRDKIEFLCSVTSVLIIVNIFLFLLRFFKRKGENNQRANVAFAFMVLMLLPVFFEGIHLIWQGGKYVAFPLRGGYTIYFSMIYCFVESISVEICYLEKRYGLSLLKYRNLLTVSLIVPAIIFTFFCIKEAGYHNAMRYMPGQSIAENDGLYSQGEALYSRWHGNTPVTERYKILDAAMNSNYGLIADIPMIGNFIHLIPNRALVTNRGLGYAQIYTRLSDTGGTAFSDALLGYQYTLSRTRELGPILYEKQDIVGDLAIYKNQYVFPFGFLLNDSYEDPKLELEDVPFQNQNWISRAVLGEDVLHISEHPLHSDVIEMKADYDCAIYIYKRDMENRLQFTVNGETILWPTYPDSEQSYYAIYFNDGILYLGSFEKGEDIEIKYEVEDEGTFELAVCNLELMRANVPENVITEMSFSSNGVTLEANVLKERALLYLPISNIDGWRARVNDKKTDIETVFGDYMAIPLKNGKNEIELVFYPPGYVLGSVISVCSLIILIGLWIAERKNIVVRPMICLEKLSCVVYISILVALAFLMVLFIGIKLYSVLQWILIRIYWRLA